MGRRPSMHGPHARCLLIVLTLGGIPLVSSVSLAQNLVPNHSFEGRFDCPSTLTHWDRMHFFHSPTLATPDYFNACDNDLVGVPANQLGDEPAHHGNAYAGFIGTYQGNLGPWFEYLQVPLKSTLVAGETYQLTFYVSLADGSGWATTEIGAAFSPVHVSTIEYDSLVTEAPFLSPRVLNTGLPLFNTNGWTQVTGSFVADGDERFLIIGNFGDETQVPVPVTPVPGYLEEIEDHAYYYLDSVSLLAAGCSVIDFDSLAVSGPGFAHVTPPHLEDGYEVDNLALPDFIVYGDEHPNYTMSPAVTSDTLDFEVSRQGGGSFDLCSLQFSDINPILSSARLLVGGVPEDFPLTAEPPELQTIYPAGYSNLTSFRIQGLLQFPFVVDDITLCTDGCVGLGNVAPGIYRVQGAETGVGFSWRIAPDPTIVDVPWPFAGGLKAAFAASINANDPPGAVAWVDLDVFQRLAVMFDEGSTLLVGPESGTPTCTVDLNPTGCSFNPTIWDATLLPSSPPGGGAGPPPVLPAGTWGIAVLAIALTAAGVAGARWRPRAATPSRCVPSRSAPSWHRRTRR